MLQVTQQASGQGRARIPPRAPLLLGAPSSTSPLLLLLSCGKDLPVLSGADTPPPKALTGGLSALALEEGCRLVPGFAEKHPAGRGDSSRWLQQVPKPPWLSEENSWGPLAPGRGVGGRGSPLRALCPRCLDSVRTHPQEAPAPLPWRESREWEPGGCPGGRRRGRSRERVGREPLRSEQQGAREGAPRRTGGGRRESPGPRGDAKRRPVCRARAGVHASGPGTPGRPRPPAGEPGPGRAAALCREEAPPGPAGAPAELCAECPRRARAAAPPRPHGRRRRRRPASLRAARPRPPAERGRHGDGIAGAACVYSQPSARKFGRRLPGAPPRAGGGRGRSGEGARRGGR